MDNGAHMKLYLPWTTLTIKIMLTCTVVCGAVTGSASAAWTTESTPSPVGATGSTLYRDSCLSSEWCMAVGSYLEAGGRKTLAEKRNGSWSAETPPNPGTGTNPELWAVSCPTTELCMAVGRYINTESYPTEIADEWTAAGGWKAQTLIPPAGGFASELGSISCPTATECVAGGDYHNSGGERTLTQHWVSGTWTAEEPPLPTGLGYPAISGISCPEAKSCLAVGEAKVLSTLVQVPLAYELASATWTAREPLSGAKDTGYALTSVSCPKKINECVTVGRFTNEGAEVEVLGEEWKSSKWEYQHVLDNGVPSELFTNFCPTSIGSCVAVGHGTSGGASVTLGEESTASTWSLMTTANETGATVDTLDGVSCHTLTYCFAVGSYTKSGKTWSLAEHN
jgi:hypothetical protein